MRLSSNLKEKKVQAKCLYPANLRIKLDAGEKTFATLTEAAPLLKELRVRTWCDIEDELKEGWTCNRKSQRDTALSTSDLRALVQEEL